MNQQSVKIITSPIKTMKYAWKSVKIVALSQMLEYLESGEKHRSRQLACFSVKRGSLQTKVIPKPMLPSTVFLFIGHFSMHTVCCCMADWVTFKVNIHFQEQNKTENDSKHSPFPSSNNLNNVNFGVNKILPKAGCVRL